MLLNSIDRRNLCPQKPPQSTIMIMKADELHTRRTRVDVSCLEKHACS